MFQYDFSQFGWFPTKRSYDEEKFGPCYERLQFVGRVELNMTDHSIVETNYHPLRQEDIDKNLIDIKKQLKYADRGNMFCFAVLASIFDHREHIDGESFPTVFNTLDTNEQPSFSNGIYTKTNIITHICVNEDVNNIQSDDNDIINIIPHNWGKDDYDLYVDNYIVLAGYSKKDDGHLYTTDGNHFYAYLLYHTEVMEDDTNIPSPGIYKFISFFKQQVLEETVKIFKILEHDTTCSVVVILNECPVFCNRINRTEFLIHNMEERVLVAREYSVSFFFFLIENWYGTYIFIRY